MFKSIKLSLLATLVLVVFFVFPNLVSAQVVGDTPTPQVNSACVDLQYNLTYKKSKDSNTNGEVSDLQSFLQEQGFLNSDPTGYFGALTFSAVKAFQTQNGLLAYGYVGAVTRETIKNVSCNGGESTPFPPNPNLPVGCLSTSGFSSITGQSCLSGDKKACTQEFRSCPDGSTMPRDSSCGWHPEQCSTNIPSSSNSVVIKGNPTLQLGYDSSNKEASLTATYDVSVTAGMGVNLKLYKYGAFDNDTYAFRIDLNKGNNPKTSGATNGDYYKVSGNAIDNGNYWEIPAGQTAVFHLTAVLPNPKTLFAGSYNATISTYKLDGGIDNTKPRMIGNLTTNSVTIIGETSPYINNIILSPNGGETINIGDNQPIRISFKPVYGQKYFFALVDVSGNGISLVREGVDSSVIGIAADKQVIDYYAVKDWVNSHGSQYKLKACSNNVCDLSDNYFTVTSGTVATNVPTVEFIGIPTISLQYNSAGKEANLVSSAKVKVTTGSMPIDSYAIASSVYLYSNGKYASSNSMKFSPEVQYGVNKIPANSSVTYTLTETVPTRELFAGSYTLALTPFTYLENGNVNNPMTIHPSSFIGVTSVNSTGVSIINGVKPVTIIGETSPYITSVVHDPMPSAVGYYNIYGNRFNPTSNYVTINGITKVLSSVLLAGVSTYGIPLDNRGLIMLKLSDFGITQTGNYIVQISNSEGGSNNYAFDFTGSNASSGVTLARTPGFTNQVVSPHTSDVKIGSFTIKNNTSGQENLSNIGVNLSVSGYPVTNLSNLRLMVDSQMTLSTPIGNPKQGINNFPVNWSIGANASPSVDIYADIGGAPSGSVTTNMVVDGLTSKDGVSVTSSVSYLADPTLSQSSPVSQFVTGGSNFGIATFRLATAQAGTNATLRELGFTTTGLDAMVSITVGGVTSSVLGSGASDTTTISGLNIPISSYGTDIPVTVKFNGFQYSSTGGPLISGISNVGLILNYAEATSGGGQVITTKSQTPSNKMTLVASKPTVQVSAGGQNSLVLGTENKIGEFTVTADANGKISLPSIGLALSSSGITNVYYEAFRVTSGNTTIVINENGYDGSEYINFYSPYEIGAGQSTTFSVYARVNGMAQAGAIPTVSSRLLQSNFTWNDVIGGGMSYSGINVQNFPTNSYTIRGDGNVIVPPTVSIEASPVSINPGQSATITWSSTGANSCVANSVNGADRDWMGNTYANGKPSGSVTVSPTVTSTYEILCSSYSQSVNKTVTVTVDQAPTPVINSLSPAHVSEGTVVTINGTNLSQVSSIEFYSGSGQIVSNLTPSSISATSVVFTVSSQFALNTTPGVYQLGVVSNTCPGGCSSNRVGITLEVPAVQTPTGQWSYQSECSTTCGTSQSTQTQVCSGGNGGCSGSAQSRTCNATQACVVTPTCSDPVAYYYYYAPDVKVAGADALNHWNTYGYKEGRQSCWQAPAVVAPGTSNNKPTGVIDTVSSGPVGSCGNVAGWAYDPDNYSASTEINLYVDGPAGAGIGFNAGATTGARPDLNQYFNISGTHGYNYQIPNLTPGNHTVYSYSHGLDTSGKQAPNEAVLLVNSPMSFNCTNPVAFLKSSSQKPVVLGDYTMCVDIPYNMHRGYEDNNVKNLQSFLVQKGLLTDIPSGFYGDKTVEAVKSYQSSKGLPVTGMVYNFTRQAIKAETCK